VLFGVYCPAYRDSSRSEFRLGFLKVLDSRIRNLVAMGKRVIVAGDFNIAREELDTAAPQESMRKLGLDGQEFVSTAERRIFNQLLVGGKVFGERDKGHEKPIMWDICRGFHKQRKGMFTCWDTKINARPGNFGARVDYVLCSADMKDWFSESNIQEGLMVGSF
jgi:AP endonuclease 2